MSWEDEERRMQEDALFGCLGEIIEILKRIEAALTKEPPRYRPYSGGK